MTDHLVERSNLRDAGIAVVIGLGLAALVGMASGCSPQQSASLMPMMGMGTSIASQASSLYFQQQQTQQQADLQRQQEQIQLEQLRANQR